MAQQNFRKGFNSGEPQWLRVRQHKQWITAGDLGPERDGVGWHDT